MNIAKIVHQANKAYYESIDDFTQVPWEQADSSIQLSATQGVAKVLSTPGITPEESHQSWLEFKEKQGWKYGKVKSDHLKEHPCMVPFDELPEEQQIKDKLFIAICNVFADEPVNQDAGLKLALEGANSRIAALEDLLADSVVALEDCLADAEESSRSNTDKPMHLQEDEPPKSGSKLSSDTKSEVKAGGDPTEIGDNKRPDIAGNDTGIKLKSEPKKPSKGKGPKLS